MSHISDLFSNLFLSAELTGFDESDKYHRNQNYFTTTKPSSFLSDDRPPTSSHEAAFKVGASLAKGSSHKTFFVLRNRSHKSAFPLEFPQQVPEETTILNTAEQPISKKYEANPDAFKRERAQLEDPPEKKSYRGMKTDMISKAIYKVTKNFNKTSEKTLDMMQKTAAPVFDTIKKFFNEPDPDPYQFRAVRWSTRAFSEDWHYKALPWYSGAVPHAFPYLPKAAQAQYFVNILSEYVSQKEDLEDASEAYLDLMEANTVEGNIHSATAQAAALAANRANRAANAIKIVEDIWNPVVNIKIQQNRKRLRKFFSDKLKEAEEAQLLAAEARGEEHQGESVLSEEEQREQAATQAKLVSELAVKEVISRNQQKITSFKGGGKNAVRLGGVDEPIAAATKQMPTKSPKPDGTPVAGEANETSEAGTNGAAPPTPEEATPTTDEAPPTTDEATPTSGGVADKPQGSFDKGRATSDTNETKDDFAVTEESEENAEDGLYSSDYEPPVGGIANLASPENTVHKLLARVEKLSLQDLIAHANPLQKRELEKLQGKLQEMRTELSKVKDEIDLKKKYFVNRTILMNGGPKITALELNNPNRFWPFTKRGKYSDSEKEYTIGSDNAIDENPSQVKHEMIQQEMETLKNREVHLDDLLGSKITDSPLERGYVKPELTDIESRMSKRMVDVGYNLGNGPSSTGYNRQRPRNIITMGSTEIQDGLQRQIEGKRYVAAKNAKAKEGGDFEKVHVNPTGADPSQKPYFYPIRNINSVRREEDKFLTAWRKTMHDKIEATREQKSFEATQRAEMEKAMKLE